MAGLGTSVTWACARAAQNRNGAAAVATASLKNERRKGCVYWRGGSTGPQRAGVGAEGGAARVKKRAPASRERPQGISRHGLVAREVAPAPQPTACVGRLGPHCT